MEDGRILNLVLHFLQGATLSDVIPVAMSGALFFFTSSGPMLRGANQSGQGSISYNGCAHVQVRGSKGSVAMLFAKRSVGVTPEI